MLQMYGHDVAGKKLSFQWAVSLNTKEVKLNLKGDKVLSSKPILDCVCKSLSGYHVLLPCFGPMFGV